MANREILGIDLNDASFERFKKSFDDYSKELDHIPLKWRRLSQVMGASNQSFTRDLSAMKEMLSSSAFATTKMTAAFHDLASAIGQSNVGLSRMHKNVSGISKAFSGIARFMWGLGKLGLGFGVGSLIGGFFGVRSLAEAGAQSGVNSRALGLSVGQMKSWQTAFGPAMTNLNGLMSAAASIRFNPSGPQRAFLESYGHVSPNQIVNESNVQVMAQLTRALRNFYQKTPHGTGAMGATLGAFQLGISAGEVRNLGRMSGSLFNESLGKAMNPARWRALGIPTHTVDALTRMVQTFHTVGEKIAAILERKLGLAGKSIDSLARVIGNDLVVLVNNMITPKNIKAAIDGIKAVANYMGSPAFKNEIKEFASGMKLFFKVMDWLFKRFVGFGKLIGVTAASATHPGFFHKDLGRHPFAYTGANSYTSHGIWSVWQKHLQMRKDLSFIHPLPYPWQSQSQLWNSGVQQGQNALGVDILNTLKEIRDTLSSGLPGGKLWRHMSTNDRVSLQGWSTSLGGG